VSGSLLITETPTPKRPLTGRAVHHRKLRVDEVHKLDLAAMRRAGFFEGAPDKVWSSSWTWGFATEVHSQVYYMRVDGPDGPAAVVLGHRETPDSPEPPIVYPVRLLATRPYYGGRRIWWECPGAVNGVPCRRRVRILFRPAGAKICACRVAPEDGTGIICGLP
jgi:hypothetical protein